MGERVHPAFDPVQLDWSIKYSYSALLTRLIHRFAGVRRGMRIVEVGCGSGFWGRLLASGLQGDGSLLAIDSDPAMVEKASEAMPAAGLGLTECRVAEATATGLPDGYADLTTCHRLLTVVPDPMAVVREMVRITRPRGLVLLNEHDHSRQVFWEPDDPDLARLRHRGMQAFVQTTRMVYGRDNALGPQLPALAIAGGLTDLRLLGLLVPYGPLPFDEKVPGRERLSYFQWLAQQTEREGDPNLASAWGLEWSNLDQREYVDRELRSIRGRLESPRSLRTWGRVTLVPRVLVRGQVRHPRRPGRRNP
jgi:ubiquinone/menaquinone biosynthesis C-methylase UbiE